MKRSTDNAIDHFFARYLALVRATTHDLPVAEYDPALRSPCEIGRVDDEGMTRWRPVRREEPADCSILSAVVGEPIHPDVRAWYSRWWSFPLEAAWGDDVLLPVVASGPIEFSQRLESAARYALACRNAGRPVAVPVAVRVLGGCVTVRHSDGAVRIDAQGCAADIIADSLTVLLDRLVPVPL